MLLRYLIFLCVIQAFTGHAQVNVNDANLVQWFTNNGFAGCLTGSTLNTNCPMVQNCTKINVSFSGASNLEVFDYFPVLDTLIATNCQLTDPINLNSYTIRRLDLSNNSIPAVYGLPQPLIYLNLDDNDIASLASLPFSLEYLYCNSNALTSLPSLPYGLKVLEARDNELVSIPVLNPVLELLDVGVNQLTQIPDLNQSQLKRVYVDNNDIAAIPNFPIQLIAFDGKRNNLNTIPTLSSIWLDSLNLSNNLLEQAPAFVGPVRYLNLSYNALDSLPLYPSMIRPCSLLVGANNLSYIEAISARTRYFDVGFNNLQTLPTLPDSCQYLGCNANQLSQIPNLPLYLQTLVCSNNPLTSDLPQLPAQLYTLHADSCNLSQLPALPPVLYRLFVKGNQLTSIDAIPASLAFLNASYNALTSITSSATIYRQFDVRNNPNLLCLPAIEKFINSSSCNSIINCFNIDQTGITCLPNIIQYSFEHPQFDTLSLCGIFSNPASCPIAWNIAGRTFQTTNSNCQPAFFEGDVENVKLKLRQGGITLQQVYTNHLGWYSFDTGFDEFEIVVDTAFLPFDVVCPTNNSFVSNPGGNDTLDFGGDFKLRCPDGIDLAAISLAQISGLFFPNQSAVLSYRAGDLAQQFGVSCNTSGLPGTIQITLEGPGGLYLGGNSQATTDTLTIPIDDLGTYAFDLSHAFSVITDSFPGQDTMMLITLRIFAEGATEIDTTNNAITLGFPVITSYDPNYKTVYPSHIDNGGQWHFYSIHFQNTGSAPAINILVKDTLSAWLDWDSFTRLASSHDNFAQVLDDGIVHFSFPNIILADSASDPEGSKGWVQFKIKSKSNLPGPYFEIDNRASIYFDFNEPVNTDYCTITYCPGVAAEQTVILCYGDSVRVGNSWYYTEGNYSDRLSSMYGCDSLVYTSVIELNPNSADTMRIERCQGTPFLVNGAVYMEPGYYLTAIPSSQNCDSNIVFELVWNNPETQEVVQVLCEGQTTSISGVHYQAPDTVVQVYSDHFCTSTTIHYLEEIPIPLEVSQNLQTLTASPGYAAYQWINCMTNMPIAGTNNPVYTPSASGMYAVRVTNAQGCTKQSSCYTVTVLDVKGISSSSFKIFPNPVTDEMRVVIHQGVATQRLEILDLCGRSLFNQAVNGQILTIPLHAWEAGVYVLRLHTVSGSVAQQRFVIAR